MDNEDWSTYMRISLDSQFIIYGASVRGKEYYKIIVQNNMKVLAFIDKDASKIQYVNNIPVYELMDLEQIPISKQEVILVISISNVFEHYDLAEKLNNMGFCYIVYKELSDRTIYGKKINQLFQAISIPFQKIGLKGLELPMFRMKGKSLVEEEKNPFVIKPVPVDLLFGLSKEFYLSVAEKKNEKIIELVPDKNILYFTINKDMMRFFLQSVNEKEWNTYIQLYFEQRNCMIKDELINPENEERHLQDRYYIFQNMEVLYNTNIDFYNDNPVEVEWNVKGYFNIQDGNNRAAFLLAKGRNMIPCRMSYKEYKLWLNEEKLQAVENCINQIGTVQYPISNPYFLNRVSKSMPFCYLKLRKIGEWLYKNNIQIENIDILDAGCKNGFMGQYFARMGAKVTAIEADALYRHLCNLVNNLLFVEETVLSDYVQLRGKKYDIVLVPYWISSDLSVILEYAKHILIIDTINPELIFSNAAVSDYFEGEEVCQLFCENRIIHTIIFIKK